MIIKYNIVLMSITDTRAEEDIAITVLLGAFFEEI